RSTRVRHEIILYTVASTADPAVFGRRRRLWHVHWHVHLREGRRRQELVWAGCSALRRWALRTGLAPWGRCKAAYPRQGRQDCVRSSIASSEGRPIDVANRCATTLSVSGSASGSGSPRSTTYCAAF